MRTAQGHRAGVLTTALDHQLFAINTLKTLWNSDSVRGRKEQGPVYFLSWESHCTYGCFLLIWGFHSHSYLHAVTFSSILAYSLPSQTLVSSLLYSAEINIQHSWKETRYSLSLNILFLQCAWLVCLSLCTLLTRENQRRPFMYKYYLMNYFLYMYWGQQYTRIACLSNSV